MCKGTNFSNNMQEIGSLLSFLEERGGIKKVHFSNRELNMYFCPQFTIEKRGYKINVIPAWKF